MKRLSINRFFTNKRNPRKRLNIKQSSLAQHFSQKDKESNELQNCIRKFSENKVNDSQSIKLDNDKISHQNSLRNNLRLGIGTDVGLFYSNAQITSIPKFVHPKDNIIKSRSKPIRMNINVNNIR